MILFIFVTMLVSLTMRLAVAAIAATVRLVVALVRRPLLAVALAAGATWILSAPWAYRIVTTAVLAVAVWWTAERRRPARSLRPQTISAR